MQLLDLLLTHQPALFALIAAVFALPAIFVLARRLFSEDVNLSASWHAHEEHEHEVSFDDASGSRFPPSTFVSVLLVLALVTAGFFLGRLQPISATAALDPPTVTVDSLSNKRLVIFLHGWNGDPQDTWKAFPGLVAADPRFASFNVLPIAYPTFQIRRNLTIKQMARWLNEQMVRDGAYQRYDEIWIVAHSMGGLIAREMLLENRLSRDNRQYKGLIEIATPHLGADMGQLLSALGLSSGFSEDLSPGSPMLSDLGDAWNSLKDRPRTYCLTSAQDAIVTQASATFQCDDYLRYPQWGHTDMVKPTGPADERYRVPLARLLEHA